MKGIKIDFVNNTITINKNVYKQSQHKGSAEYSELMRLKESFPHMDIVVRQATRKRKNNRIKYDKMIKYIDCQNNSTALLKEFAAIRELSKSQDSAYAYVVDWFKKKFPEFEKFPEFDENGNVVQAVA